MNTRPGSRAIAANSGAFDPKLAKPVIIAGNGDQIDLSAQFAGPSSFGLFKDFIQTSSQAGLPLSITSPDKKQLAPRVRFCLASVWRADSVARRLRHFLRDGEHGWPRQ